jgi:hypothetical protein
VITDAYDRISTLPELADVSFDFGLDQLGRNDRPPPRIVISPMTEGFDRITPTRRTSPDQRSVFTRISSLKARVWGAVGTQAATSEDQYRAAEELMRRFIVLMHREFYGEFNPVSAEWVEVEKGESQFGRALDITFTLQIPLFETSDENGTTTATPTTSIQTNAFDPLVPIP